MLSSPNFCVGSGIFLNWDQSCDVILANGCSYFVHCFSQPIHSVSLVLDFKEAHQLLKVVMYVQLLESKKFGQERTVKSVKEIA